MLIDKETLRLVFGLKLRSLREEKKFSLKDLSKKTGLSPSYLNEIEKGKKYPKNEKILLLAEALNEKYENLISLELKKEFQLVKKLLDNNVLKSLPFDIFGLPTQTLFDLIHEGPEKVTALVGTLLELARAHNIQIDDIFYAFLRSYIDMHGNFFPELETLALEFSQENKIDLTMSEVLLYENLKKILMQQFRLKVVEEELYVKGTKLNRIFYYLKNKTLYLSSEIDLKEKNFILAREIGFRFLKFDQRPLCSLIEELNSFEQLHNHFKASYFASALLIPFHDLKDKITELFLEEKWNSLKFEQIFLAYHPPIESVIHRFTQILPKEFNINQLFYLRYEYDSLLNRYEISRELHLSSLHGPHRIKGHEHYCNRWLIGKLSRDILTSDEKIKIGIQRSLFVDNRNDYLITAAAFKNPLNPSKTTTVCLGLLISEELMEKINFLKDPQLKTVEVGETCEKCSLSTCLERRAPYDVPLELLLRDDND